MPTAEESWRLTEAARARIRAEHPCSSQPRVKVRVSPLSPDQQLDQEFGFVGWDDSCRAPLLTDEADFRECRRITGHPLDDGIGHACGFGPSRVQWL